MTPVFRHGRLRLYLLRLLDEEPRHGYEVIRLLRDRFMGVYAPSPGTIYPRLARLEEEGLVTHDEENGRKVYRITEAGREELRNRGDELDELEEELSASVSDIVREVREDVRDTVRTLREELTKAAREMRGAEREQAKQARDAAREAAEAAREQARHARGTAREAADAAREQARQAKETAWAQARQAREQARRLTREEAFSRGRRFFEEAHLHDDTRDQGGGKGSWGDWSHWADWPGQSDLGALRDFERLARDFVADLRSVAWDSSTIVGTDVVPTLRDILADTLDRIRTEVFDIHHDDPAKPADPADPAKPADPADPADQAGAPAPPGSAAPPEPPVAPAPPVPSASSEQSEPPEPPEPKAPSEP
jgi:DNA-binding PadR family transcriptional regulator